MVIADKKVGPPAILGKQRVGKCARECLSAFVGRFEIEEGPDTRLKPRRSMGAARRVFAEAGSGRRGHVVAPDANLDWTPRGRERLSELTIPVLVVHGRRDPFSPVGNGESLAREIPGARLLVLERSPTAIPVAAAGGVASAMLEL